MSQGSRFAKLAMCRGSLFSEHMNLYLSPYTVFAVI